MARAVAADFGLPMERRGRRDAPPLWWRDNPFLHRTVRGESRRATIFWRMFTLIVIMGGIFLACLYLIHQFPRPINAFSRSMLGVPAFGLVAMILPFIQIIAVMSVRSVVSPSLIVEARRQTLDGLLSTPMRPAEMLLAMTTGPTIVALLVSLSALPIYVLLMQLGGMEATDILSLYLLLAALAFAPPTYTLPALAGGASPEQAALLAKAQQGRPDRQQAFTGSGVGFFWFFYLSIFWSRLPTGNVIAHLTAPLAMPHGPIQMLVVVTWPYTLVKLLLQPLPFYQISLPTLVYLLPLTFAGKISAMLSTAASLTASTTSEIVRTPIFRRHAAIALWRRRILLLCIVGYAWRISIVSGDAAAVLGRASGAGWDEAGLLTIFCGLSLLAMYGRSAAMHTMSRKTKRLVTPRLVARRAMRRVIRPLKAALLLFGAVCLLAWDSPFTMATGKTLGNLALAAVAILTYGVGAKALFSVFVTRRKIAALPQWLLLLGMPLAPLSAIWLSGPAVHIAALSPLGVWLMLFPCAQNWLLSTSIGLLRAPGWPFVDQISFFEAAAAPTVAGLLFLRIAYSLQRAPATAPRAEATLTGAADALAVAPQKPPVRSAPVTNAERTAALMAWITKRVDNPLFIREVRAQTRSGAWFQWLQLTPFIVLALQAATVVYPDMVGVTASGLGWFRFFDVPGMSATLATPLAFVALAGGVMTIQIYTNLLRLAPVTEAMLQRDQQRGVLGAILLTPLKTRQIFWGMLLGQCALAGLQWVGWSAVLLLLNLEAAYTVDLGPALVAWIVGQVFAASLLTFTAAAGGAMATHLIKAPNWKGMSILLSLLAIGGVLYLEYFVFADQYQAIDPSWKRMTAYLLTGVAAAIPLTALASAYGLWRLQRLRDRDIAFGDSIPR